MHMVVYPSKVHLDNWGKLGNKDWNFDKLAPYYNKFEHFTTPSEKTAKALNTSEVDPSLHGAKGPIHPTIPESYWPLAETWVPTLKNLGHGLHANSKSGISAGGYSTMCFLDPRTATRSYAAIAYYAPNVARSNLFLITDSLVKKISLTGKDPDVAASGVSFTVNGKDFTVYAERGASLRGCFWFAADP